ncbi:MAG: hypothetical protein Q9208_000339 [Pyrenodesmia sp. 3 TL-2023]
MPARVSPTELGRYRKRREPYPYQAFHAASVYLTRATAKNDHPRAPPARPKPLDFPRYQIQGDLNAVRQYANDFDRLFVDLEKGVSPPHLETLNISLLEETPLDRLIPDGYLPPQEWLQPPSQASETPNAQHNSIKLSNNFPVPGHGAFHDRVKELLYDMDEAFDVTSGKRSGSAANTIRLGYSHKFYQHLLLMAEYWDTSKDNYTTSSKENEKETYTGRRYGAGPDMPASYREDTICALVEMCIWPFRCCIQNPRSTVWRKLCFQNRNLPIYGVTSAVCRNTTDRQKARKGIGEGPLMGIHCRNTTTFRAEAAQKGQGREELMDLLFEVGAALLVAQKRAREGKEEEHPGKDKYWVDRSKRHLGELGGGQQDRDTDERARREIQAFGEPMEGVQEQEGSSGSSSSVVEGGGNGSRKRKQRPGAQAYLDAKAPESTWESKVEYKMIGKEAGSGADKIFLLSSLNHHISLLSLHVDDRYLDFITHGSATHPGFDPSRQEWWILEVKRSRWYDLFKAEDRAEAMRGIWGAMGWMMRKEEGSDEG